MYAGNANKPASIAASMCTEGRQFTPLADIPAGLQRAWSSRKQFIDLVEQAAEVVAITLKPQLCYEKDVLGLSIALLLWLNLLGALTVVQNG